MGIDFHSHILPGIDDGSASVQESIEMLRMEAEQGIRLVVATPHFYPKHDSPEKFLARRARAEAQLREELTRHQGLPEITVGAEVYYFHGISETDALKDLTIGKKGFILLEMMGAPWTNSMYTELERIYIYHNIVPVIAHIDRYIRPFQTYGIPERLSELPVLVQANASFFLKPSTRAMALRMLRKKQIHMLGSDCHNLTDRAPNLGDARQLILRRLGEESLQFLEQTGGRIFF